MGIAFSDFSGGGGGITVNGFYLYTGPSGNTNFELVEPMPKGAYNVSTNKTDTSYDIYAITASGELVGYTTTSILVATKEFARVSVIGATADDIISFESKYTTFTESKTNIDDGAPPFITAVSVVELESYDDTTVVTGGNFATNVEVYFVGTNAVDLAAKNIVRNSSAELVVTRPDALIPDHSPYDVKIINPGIPLPTQAPLQHILPDAITAGTYPLWVTTAPLFWDIGETTSLTFVAEDVESSDIDYEIIAGTLWDGFAFDQETGTITGTDTALIPGDKMTLTIRATDTAGNVGSFDGDELVTYEKTFDIFANQVPVHSFDFDVFTDAGSLPPVFMPNLSSAISQFRPGITI